MGQTRRGMVDNQPWITELFGEIKHGWKTEVRWVKCKVVIIQHFLFLFFSSSFLLVFPKYLIPSNFENYSTWNIIKSGTSRGFPFSLICSVPVYTFSISVVSVTAYKSHRKISEIQLCITRICIIVNNNNNNKLLLTSSIYFFLMITFLYSAVDHVWRSIHLD